MQLTSAPTISKAASRVESYRRRIYEFPNARSAFKAILQGLRRCSGVDEVLLPAYIGWSPREGSGVMDPIKELGLTPVFYRMTKRLCIDVDHVAFCLRKSRARVLLMIHYFGFPDPEYRRVCQMARERGLIVVEDEAHAMFSDFVGGICGRAGEFAIMSLPKLLPVPQGGLLLVNNLVAANIEGSFDLPQSEEASAVDFREYDAYSIANERRRHAATLIKLVSEVPEVELLMPLSDGVIPQTLPIVLKTGYRDAIYRQLNAEGFGVVTLYHTMVSDLKESEYPEAHWLAKRILNLPVHQDVDADSLSPMVNRLSELLQS